MTPVDLQTISYKELLARQQNLRDTIMTLSEELNSVELAIREREDGLQLGKRGPRGPERYDTTMELGEPSA